MAFKVKTLKGEGDWRPYHLIPRCALCILAMIIIDSLVAIMGITRKTNFIDLLLLTFVVLSLCWTTFFLIRPIFRASLLHPGWAVGLDLICFPMIGTWSIAGAMQGVRYSEYLGVCWGYDLYQDGQCGSHSGVVSGLGWLAYTSGFLMTCVTITSHVAVSFIELLDQADLFPNRIIHLALFVLACCDIYRYNGEKRDQKRFEIEFKLKGWKSSPYSVINESEERIPRVALQPRFDTESNHSRCHHMNHSRTHSRSHSRSDSRVSATEASFVKPEHSVLELGPGKHGSLGVPYESENGRCQGLRAAESF